MNKKGFTLVELLAVIAIMALIAGVAIPNVVNMLDKGKKEDYIKDAKAIISKVKYMYNLKTYQAKFQSQGSCKTINLENISFDITTDAFGGTYDKTNSIVKACEVGDKTEFSIDLRSDQKCLATQDSCDFVKESELGINKVVDNQA